MADELFPDPKPVLEWSLPKDFVHGQMECYIANVGPIYCFIDEEYVDSQNPSAWMATVNKEPIRPGPGEEEWMFPGRTSEWGFTDKRAAMVACENKVREILDDLQTWVRLLGPKPR